MSAKVINLSFSALQEKIYRIRATEGKGQCNALSKNAKRNHRKTLNPILLLTSEAFDAVAVVASYNGRLDQFW